MQKQVLYSRINGITTFRSLNEVGEVTKTVSTPTLLASPVTDDFKAFPARMLTVQGADISASMSLKTLSAVTGKTSVGEFSQIIANLAVTNAPCYTDKGIGRSLYLASLKDIPTNKSIKDQPIPIVHLTVYNKDGKAGMTVHEGDITIRATDIKIHLKAECADIRVLVSLLNKGELFKII